MGHRGAALMVGVVAGCLAFAASASAATRTVMMGTPPNVQKTFQMQYSADVNDFFPHRLTVHVGDRVRFVPVGFHTVDLPPKGGTALPFLSPNGQPVAGANDAAGAPFWFNGQPQLGFTPALLNFTYGKTLSYNTTKRVESGLPLQNKPKPLTVRFTKAGTFTYFCDLHPGMQGVVSVVPKGKRVPSAKAVRKSVAAQVRRDIKIAKGLVKATPPAGVVDVGNAGPHGVEFYGMLPGSVDIAAGTSLTFRMTKDSYEAHTATFGPGNPEGEPDSYLGKLAASFEAPTIDPAAIYPSDAPGGPSTLGPTTHGNGFWNTGAIDASNATPLPLSGSVQFTTPGTYQYYCLIHPFMHGTVVVR